MMAFLEWFNRPAPEPDLRKPAIAHLWFVSIHPYDDGNGRIARAITDLALSRCDDTDTRLYSMSAEILRQRSRYYRALQVTQSDSMNITAWMLWFFDCLTDAMIQGWKTNRVRTTTSPAPNLLTAGRSVITRPTNKLT